MPAKNLGGKAEEDDFPIVAAAAGGEPSGHSSQGVGSATAAVM